jgi:hypothetical protein
VSGVQLEGDGRTIRSDGTRLSPLPLPQRGFSERSGTVFNRLQYPADVVCLVVFWRLRSKLSLRDLVEMFALRGLIFTHEAVREWEARLALHMTEELRKARRGIKGRYLRGFKSIAVAHRFCRAYDEVRHFLRSPSPRGRRLSLGDRRWFHLRRVNRLLAIMEQTA